jgi:hypothetical protein
MLHACLQQNFLLHTCNQSVSYHRQLYKMKIKMKRSELVKIKNTNTYGTE